MYWASVDSNTPANSGYDLGLPGEPQGRAGVRAVRQDRVLSQRAAWAFTATTCAAPPSRSIPPIQRSLCAVPLLVRSRGAEVGVRTQPSRASIRRWRCSCSISTPSCCSSATPAPPSPAGRAAASASNGPTATGRCPGRRSTSTSPTPRRASPTIDPAGSFIPGAPTLVASGRHRPGRPTPAGSAPCAGATSAPRPLIEDGSVWSAPDLDRRTARGLRLRLGLKLQRSTASTSSTPRPSQIDYYYQSQLRGEAAPVNDIHFHPVEPLAFRFTVAKAF